MREIKRQKAFLADIKRHGRSDLFDEIDSILYYLEKGEPKQNP
jgi:hypothetical protein